MSSRLPARLRDCSHFRHSCAGRNLRSRPRLSLALNIQRQGRSRWVVAASWRVLRWSSRGFPACAGMTKRRVGTTGRCAGTIEVGIGMTEGWCRGGRRAWCSARRDTRGKRGYDASNLCAGRTEVRRGWARAWSHFRHSCAGRNLRSRPRLSLALNIQRRGGAALVGRRSIAACIGAGVRLGSCLRRNDGKARRNDGKVRRNDRGGRRDGMGVGVGLGAHTARGPR